MLRVLSPAEFGVFTFLLVAAQFSWGIWSALFCAPLPVLLLETSIAEQRIGINVLGCINSDCSSVFDRRFLSGCGAARAEHISVDLFCSFMALSR